MERSHFNQHIKKHTLKWSESADTLRRAVAPRSDCLGAVSSLWD